MKFKLILLASIYGICYGLPKSVPVYKLLDGNHMPSVGLGTYPLTGKELETAVKYALEYGYSHIDTAFEYNNEKDIGNALKQWFAKGNKREGIYITSKLPSLAMRSEDVEKAVELSLKNLGLDYIDMYLIHHPFGFKRTADFKVLKDKDGNNVIDFSTNHVAIWKALEKQVKSGKLKSIGVSNFNKTQVLRIWKNSEIKPSNLQIEANVYIQQDELLGLCKELGIIVTGYSPLGSGSNIYTRNNSAAIHLPSPIKDEMVTKIAKAHNKSPAQVLLRFGLQKNLVVIPKSGNPKRIKENIDIFDFSLTSEEMNELKTLDQHGKYRKDDFLRFKGIEFSPEYPFADKIPK